MAEDEPKRPKRRERRAPRPTQRPTQRPAGPAPTEALLREAALNHLARFAATEVGLRRVLQRRVDRWARRAESEGAEPEAVARDAASARAAAARVAQAMVKAGAVDDAAFAESRARRLVRSGRSRRAIAAHLGAKGVAPATTAAALPPEEAELSAALAQCRRRRIGPFAAEPPPADPMAARAARMKALAALARAGFGREVAEAALGMDPAEAEDRLIALRQG